jgi:hypothetical protein
MPIDAKGDGDEDETAGALCDAAPSMGSCSLSEAAPSMGSMFQPEDVEYESEEEEVPCPPGQISMLLLWQQYLNLNPTAPEPSSENYVCQTLILVGGTATK